MGTLTIVYWRDIPAQVIARSGRKSAKAELPRFMEAIDAAAMRAGATGTDDYLSDWRRGDPAECSDDLEAAVAAAIAAIEEDYHAARLATLVAMAARRSRYEAAAAFEPPGKPPRRAGSRALRFWSVRHAAAMEAFYAWFERRLVKLARNCIRHIGRERLERPSPRSSGSSRACSSTAACAASACCRRPACPVR